MGVLVGASVGGGDGERVAGSAVSVGGGAADGLHADTTSKRKTTMKVYLTNRVIRPHYNPKNLLGSALRTVRAETNHKLQL
jgi:uncharacterized protein YcfJ